MEHKHIEGLIPAAFAPMNGDGTVNLGLIDQYAEFLVRQKVAAVFVNGTSGESLSLTAQERLSAARRWVQAGGKDLPVIVHVGGTCLPECKALAADAQKAGAAAIAAMGPCFFKPATLGDLADFCRQIAEAAPALDFYYYHIPALTGVNFLMAEFLPRAAEKIPTLAGAKFTFENLMDFGRSVAAMAGRFDMLFGRDEILLAGMALGARGAVGTTYNFQAATYQRLMAAFDRGDMAAARAEQLRGAAAILCLFQGGLAAFKGVMRMLGLDCGPVRPPLTSLTEDLYNKIRGELQAMGFFDRR